jgi:hypothetical protein
VRFMKARDKAFHAQSEFVQKTTPSQTERHVRMAGRSP